MCILLFSGVNNIPDGFSDNWKEAKFNKIDPYQSGFFPLKETIFFSFFFLAVPQTFCPVYDVSQIDGFCDFLGWNPLSNNLDSVW